MVNIKIYLLNPPFIQGFSRGVRGVGESTRGGTLYIPIWLSYATGVLDQSNETRLIDAQALSWGIDDVLQDISNFNPNIIVIDTNFSSLNNDIDIANLLKKQSGAITIMVGPPTSQFPNKILESGIDIVARNEYDLTLNEVVNNITKDLNEIKGISYKKNDNIIHNPNRDLTSSEDLDDIPFVSDVYNRYLNISDYFLSSSFHPTVQIFTGRGCPNQCTFCSWPKTLMGRKYRVRSIDNVLNEFEYIIDHMPAIKEIFIEDDTFTIDKNRVLEFCKKYEERRLNIVWSCNARATLDYETMKEMKKANCRLLISGFESGSDEILNNIKKGITVDQIIKFAENANKVGLLIHGDFIIGLPGETEETIAMTKKLIRMIKPDILQVLIPQPIPGTEFYDWCKMHNYLITDNPVNYLDECGYQKSIISYPKLTNEDISNEVSKILKRYYLSPHYVPLALKQVLRKNGFYELKRLVKSTYMFLKYV